mmetsp:Transcript_20488/g.51894  ORF Transcript_20488/g.51894 Transcript_20488/m.51894 type:complete len:156 (-) Transcript_20488:173-640(-)|eukprot:CAMPEP_0177651708 /NCGR_PEP_ID=MMETSP0447-20121125/12706_1 /TAXON_ID=0 /ORGANISM="Stygamoeba regulata, Strain BSH-02190019" /LENGTH=155 /DNA_ID=CAMNT_0019154835 /DNA_START=141 /DNA_END=608 /DNA_ORIENTATION=-
MCSVTKAGDYMSIKMRYLRSLNVRTNGNKTSEKPCPVSRAASVPAKQPMFSPGVDPACAQTYVEEPFFLDEDFISEFSNNTPSTDEDPRNDGSDFEEAFVMELEDSTSPAIPVPSSNPLSMPNVNNRPKVVKPQQPVASSFMVGRDRRFRAQTHL